MKLPHIQFYPGDWRKDVAVQSLSYHHRGVWFELLTLMHCSEDRGRLVSNGVPIANAGVARLLGLSEREAADAVSVLLDAGVASRDESGALYSRRMVRENEIAAVRKQNGSKGGSKTQAKLKAKLKQKPDIDIGTVNGSGNGKRKDRADTLEEVVAFCREIALRRSDAEWFWFKCEANGWRNGGEPIRDWRATLRAWKAGGYVPSIKNPERGKPPPARVESRPRNYLPPVREPTDEELQRQQKIVREASAKLREELRP